MNGSVALWDANSPKKDDVTGGRQWNLLSKAVGMLRNTAAESKQLLKCSKDLGKSAFAGNFWPLTGWRCMWWNLPERTVSLSSDVGSYWSQAALESSQSCNTATMCLKARLTGDQGTEQAAAFWDSFSLKQTPWHCSLTHAAGQAAHVQPCVNKTNSCCLSPWWVLPNPLSHPLPESQSKIQGREGSRRKSCFFGHIWGTAQDWQGIKSSDVDCPAPLRVHTGGNLFSQEIPLYFRDFQKSQVTFEGLETL